MKRYWVQGILVMSCGLLLGGCSKWHSVFEQPSTYDQCKGLQRQMVFANNIQADSTAFQIQDNKMQLQRQYSQLGCDQILSEKKDQKDTAKKTQTAKKPTTTKNIASKPKS